MSPAELARGVETKRRFLAWRHCTARTPSPRCLGVVHRWLLIPRWSALQYIHRRLRWLPHGRRVLIAPCFFLFMWRHLPLVYKHPCRALCGSRNANLYVETLLSIASFSTKKYHLLLECFSLCSCGFICLVCFSPSGLSAATRQRRRATFWAAPSSFEV